MENTKLTAEEIKKIIVDNLEWIPSSHGKIGQSTATYNKAANAIHAALSSVVQVNATPLTEEQIDEKAYQLTKEFYPGMPENVMGFIASRRFAIKVFKAALAAGMSFGGGADVVDLNDDIKELKSTIQDAEKPASSEQQALPLTVPDPKGGGPHSMPKSVQRDLTEGELWKGAGGEVVEFIKHIYDVAYVSWKEYGNMNPEKGLPQIVEEIEEWLQSQQPQAPNSYFKFDENEFKDLDREQLIATIYCVYEGAGQWEERALEAERKLADAEKPAGGGEIEERYKREAEAVFPLLEGGSEIDQYIVHSKRHGYIVALSRLQSQQPGIEIDHNAVLDKLERRPQAPSAGVSKEDVRNIATAMREYTFRNMRIVAQANNAVFAMGSVDDFVEEYHSLPSSGEQPL